MGTLAGNLLALVCIIGSALVGLVSFKASATTFVTVCYSLWVFIFLLNFFTNPPRAVLLCKRLRPSEIEAYRRYQLHFWAPGAAQAFSALMNGLRVAGLVWGAICTWKALFLLGGLSIAYFFLTSGLIVRLNPFLYLGRAAKSGNPVAVEQLSLIENIQLEREIYNSEDA